MIGVGANVVRLWGLTAEERLRRMAGAEAPNAPLLVNLGYAFDPEWLRYVADRDDHVVTRAGIPVIANISSEGERRAVSDAMASLQPLGATGLETTAFEQVDGLANEALRKKERPFMDRLTAETVPALERASYFGAYKGVTDVLTKYLWPEWALVLTRIAARAGITPNQVTIVGAILCVAATILFWHGWYWSGLALGLVFMVLDTVDGKLARCTITSSRWGHVADHGIDLIHPPFWWLAWGVGLAAYGRPLEDGILWALLGAILAGYVAQRLIEGAFISRFKIHIHVWRRFDSRFRLIAARRNPNMIILFAALIAGRPDWGLIGVAAWTLISLAVHIVQIGQAFAARRPVRSWLA